MISEDIVTILKLGNEHHIITLLDCHQFLFTIVDNVNCNSILDKNCINNNIVESLENALIKIIKIFLIINLNGKNGVDNGYSIDIHFLYRHSLANRN